MNHRAAMPASRTRPRALGHPVAALAGAKGQPGRLEVPWRFGVLLMGMPAIAWAKAGVGFFFIAIPFLVMALPLAVIVEAPVLAWLLRTGPWQALRWSLVANLVSTVLGAGIGIVADIAIFAPMGSSGAAASRATALAALVPMFFVTWWLESWMVGRMQPKDAARSPVLATLVANLLSYALLAGALAWMRFDALDYPRGDARSRVTEVFAAMGAEKVEVAEHFAQWRRFPDPRVVDVAGRSRYLRSLRVETEGRIVAQVHYPGTEDLDGKHVALAPEVSPSGAITAWHCYSPDMSPRGYRFLPAHCRQGPAPDAPGKPRPGAAGAAKP